MNDNEEIVVRNLMIIPVAKRKSFTETILNGFKNLTPQRSPQRSRANSVGNSQEDLSAPPTIERLQEVSHNLYMELEDAGFITHPQHHPQLNRYKKTEIIPR